MLFSFSFTLSPVHSNFSNRSTIYLKKKKLIPFLLDHLPISMIHDFQFFLDKISQSRIKMKFQNDDEQTRLHFTKMFKILTSMDERSSRKRIGSELEMDIHMYVHAGKLFRECTFTFAISFSSLSLFLSLPLFLNLF